MTIGHHHGHPTRDLAWHILSYAEASIDAKAVRVAKHCILDWFAVTLAGYDEPVARILREEIVPQSRGGASIVGAASRCSPVDAALINGTTSHGLDYDDVHITMLGHPTVSILPAVLALAETEGASGEAALRAFIAGYEAAVVIGGLVMPWHYEHGFHATATLGSFGAAAAAGVLLKLDHNQMAMALGLAGTQAAGLKSMFGTMAKPLHAGKAAANGVFAARLAKRGFTANPNVLETAQGFAATQGDRPIPDVLEFPARGTTVLDTLFKYHAACYLTHSTIEAVAQLCGANSLAPAQIAAIDVHVPDGHLRVCNIPSPRTGLEIKFSLRHTAALAAAGIDTARIDTYSDAMADDPVLVELRERVAVFGDHPAGTGAAVIIRKQDGGVLELDADVGVPDRDLDRQTARLAAKFQSLAEPVIGLVRTQRLRAAVDALDDAATVDRMMQLD